MKFYVMYAESLIEDYVSPSEDIEALERGCYRSEFQFLDRDPLEVEISKEGGLEFPDFICQGCIPLISENFHQLLDRIGVDNLFYKPVYLTFNELGLRELYRLALPPRIDCLDLSRCEVEVEENEFLDASELMREVKTIAIDESKVGNYKIFKLPPEYENQEIIVTEEVKAAIEQKKLSNVYFIATE